MNFMNRTLTGNRNMFTSKLQKGEGLHVKSNGATNNRIHKQRKELPRDRQGQEQQCVDSTH